jgi:hypothetical protein
MPEGARILMGDTRQWESPTILYGCLRRYSGIHKPRYLGIPEECLYSHSGLLSYSRIPENLTRVS